MLTINGRIEGPYTVACDLRIDGMITGNTTVAAGATLELHGIATGDLIVERGATAFVKGTVGGSVTNRGRVAVRGRIVGSLADVEGGHSTVHAEAASHTERH